MKPIKIKKLNPLTNSKSNANAINNALQAIANSGAQIIGIPPGGTATMTLNAQGQASPIQGGVPLKINKIKAPKPNAPAGANGNLSVNQMIAKGMAEEIKNKKVMLIELQDGQDDEENKLLDLCNELDLHREFTGRSLDSIQKEVHTRKIGDRGPEPLTKEDYMCNGCGRLMPDQCECDKNDWNLSDEKFDSWEKVDGAVNKLRMKLLRTSEDDLGMISHEDLMTMVDEVFPAHKRKSFGVDDERKTLLKKHGLDPDKSMVGKFH